jgi:carboxylate-amine ligase
MLTSRFSIGIEEEFQSVDSQSGELRSTIYTLFDKGQGLFGDRLHAEWAQSMIELTTAVCSDIATARQELYQMRALLAQVMRQEGLEPISAGTHPTTMWQTQEKTDRPRDHELEREYQDVMRQRGLFGLHVHVGGVDNKELTIQLINQLRTWVPHLLALSSNSPFWAGRFTGIKSYRSVVWQSGAPRSSLPEVIPSLDAFNRYINDLVAMQCITSGKDIWWYVRPSFPSNTIEFCICDMPATIEDTLALAALCQALIAKLTWLYERKRPMTPVLPRHYIEENLWRAVRYGLDARVADFALRRTLSMRASIHELLDFVDDIANDLGTSREMHFLRALLDDPRGTGADRQIATYQQRGNVQDVIRLLLEETMRGVEATAPVAFREAETEAHLVAIDPIRMTGKEALNEAETEAKLRAVEPIRRLRSSESEQM